MSIVGDRLICAAPWNHFFVQQDGDVRVCCMVGGEGIVLGNINKQSWQEIWEGEKYQEYRRRFLERDPEILKYCQHCLNYDKFGDGSCRHTYNSLVKDSDLAVDLLLKHPTVKSLDLRTSKACGMACIICGPWNSTRWCSEVGLPLSNITEQGQENIDQLVDNLKGSLLHLNIVGGEPFMMDEAIKLIKELQPRKKYIKLLLNTNCQTLTYKGQNVLDLLEGFKYVNVCVSLDGIGKSAEYQRYGTKWEQVKANFEEVFKRDRPDFKISVHPTISILSLLGLPDLFKYLENFDVNVLGGNMLFEPEEYDIRNIPVEAKKVVAEKLLEKAKELTPKYQELVKGWIDYMNSTDPWIPFSRTVQKIDEIDKRRKNSFLELNPEFEPWWKLD